MPRAKTMNQAKRFNAVVDLDTYTALVTLAGRQTMIEGRPVSLAEFVRDILEEAVTPDRGGCGSDRANNRPNAERLNAKEKQPALGRPDSEEGTL